MVEVVLQEDTREIMARQFAANLVAGPTEEGTDVVEVHPVLASLTSRAEAGFTRTSGRTRRRTISTARLALIVQEDRHSDPTTARPPRTREHSVSITFSTISLKSKKAASVCLRCTIRAKLNVSKRRQPGCAS